MTGKRRVIFVAILAAALILIYAGLFLFDRDNAFAWEEDQVKPIESSPAETVRIPAEKGVRYIHLSQVIHEKKQEIHILEVNPDADGVKIVPALSHDLVYGYENLSPISKRKNAYAAVNAGFFYDYGLPSGMVVAEGSLITLPTGRYPVFTLSGGKAELGVVKQDLWLEFDGGRVKADKLNMPPAGKGCVVYTPDYGATNRVLGENYTITVKNGKVAAAGFYTDSTEIPEEGMLVTLSPGDAPALSIEKRLRPGDVPLLSLERGDLLKIATEPQLPQDFHAYECGSWLVKDGSVVIGEKDAWIGVTTNNDPRTAIGIKTDGTVLLITVDGRQPGYSVGMTCRELGEFLIGYGVKSAAMLDGGASTEMIVEGKVVNKPSFKEQERPLGGGLVVICP